MQVPSGCGNERPLPNSLMYAQEHWNVTQSLKLKMLSDRPMLAVDHDKSGGISVRRDDDQSEMR